jgi:hypothetical protein
MLDNWPVMERRGIATAFATACLAFSAWAFPNMTRIITIPGAIACAILTFYLLWPEIRAIAVSLNATWVPDGKVRNGRVRGLIGFALLGCLVVGGYLVSHRTPADTEPPIPQPPAPAPENPALTLVSKYSHIIVVCKMPKRPNEIDEWQQYAKVVGESQGLTVELHGLDSDGLRIVVTPPSATTFSKVTTEIRRLKDDLYVTRIIDLTNQVTQMWADQTVTSPDDPVIMENIKRVEKLIGAPDGTCHLI